MPTGFVIKDAQGNMKQVPFDQASQYVDPQQLSSWQQHLALPQQQLQQGQVDLQKSAADTQVATQTVDPKVAQITADAVAAKQKADQANFLALTKSHFDQVKGHNDNYVSPDQYNQAKRDATQYGIGGDEFDKNFAQSYVNPNNAWYDMPEAKQIRGQIKEAANLANTYKNLSIKGSDAANFVAQHGGLLGSIGVDIGGDTRAYSKTATGLASQVRGIVGAQQGSGFRFNLQELNRIADLLPQPSDTKSAAANKLTNLNEALKTAYGIGLEDFANSGGGQ